MVRPSRATNNGGAKGGHSGCTFKVVGSKTVNYIDPATGEPKKGKCAIKGGSLLCDDHMIECKKCSANCTWPNKVYYCSRHSGDLNGGGLDAFTLGEHADFKVLGSTGHLCRPEINDNDREASPALTQVPKEWLEDPALVDLLKSDTFHAERKRFEEKLQNHSVSSMVLLGLARSIRGYVMLESWYSDWEKEHDTAPCWWDMQWSTDPRLKIAHKGFQMTDLEAWKLNGQKWKLDHLFFWQFKLMLQLEMSKIQAGLLLLLIVDTLLFAGESYAKSKHIASILAEAKGFCHSPPVTQPAVTVTGGAGCNAAAHASFMHDSSGDATGLATVTPGSLLPEDAWDDLGDASWLDLELSFRYLSFAALSLFISFDLLAIIAKGRYFAIDENWRGVMNVFGLLLVLLPWFGYLGEISSDVNSAATKSFGSNWAIVFIVGRAARNLHGSTKASAAKEAIQKEKERSIKLVAQEKGWLMDKASNYHEAFMSVENCARAGDNQPPIIGLTWSKDLPKDCVGQVDPLPTPLNFSRTDDEFVKKITQRVLEQIDARVKRFFLDERDFIAKFGPRLHKLRQKLRSKMSKIMSKISGKPEPNNKYTVNTHTIEVDYSGTLSTWSFLKGSRLTAADVQALAIDIKTDAITVEVDGVTYKTIGRVIADRVNLPKTISAAELALVMKSLRHEEVPLVGRFWSYIKVHVFGQSTATVASPKELLKAKHAIALFTRDKHHTGTGTMDFEEFVSMMLCRADTTRKQEQEEAFRMLCGGATYAGDYDKLNCLNRGTPAKYTCGDMTAKWIKPESTLLNNKEIKKETRDAFPFFPNGHWIVAKEKGQGHVGLDGSWVPGKTELKSLNVVNYGRFPVQHLSEAPSETMNPQLHDRKTHYFQYYDSMFREQLSRLDHDSDNYVQFKELSKALDEAHQGRWTHGLGPADVTALAATMETTGVSVTVAGSKYSIRTEGRVTTGTRKWTAQHSDTPNEMRSLPYMSLTWTTDNGTTLDFNTKLSDARFKEEFKTKALAAINNGATSAFNGIQGKQSVKSAMWRYIYTVNRYNTEMEFDGVVSTCFFLDRTYGFADCFDFEDRAAGSSPLQHGASPGPRFGGNGNGSTALDYHAAHMYPPEGYTVPPITTNHNGGFRGRESVGRQPGPDHWC